MTVETQKIIIHMAGGHYYASVPGTDMTGDGSTAEEAIAKMAEVYPEVAEMEHEYFGT